MWGNAVTTVFLVRHALHDLVGRVLAGRMPDVPLSPAGRLQAERLAERFAAEPLRRVISSPIQRARETAAILAGRHACAVEIDESLTEIDCGRWTGAAFADLAEDPAWQAWNQERSTAAIPGGETMAEVEARTSRLLDSLAEQDDGPVVLVSHSDVIKAMVARLIAMPLNLHDRIAIDPASITRLEMWRPGAGAIGRMNEVVTP